MFHFLKHLVSRKFLIIYTNCDVPVVASKNDLVLVVRTIDITNTDGQGHSWEDHCGGNITEKIIYFKKPSSWFGITVLTLPGCLVGREAEVFVYQCTTWSTSDQDKYKGFVDVETGCLLSSKPNEQVLVNTRFNSLLRYNQMCVLCLESFGIIYGSGIIDEDSGAVSDALKAVDTNGKQLFPSEDSFNGFEATVEHAGGASNSTERGGQIKNQEGFTQDNNPDTQLSNVKPVAGVCVEENNGLSGDSDTDSDLVLLTLNCGHTFHRECSMEMFRKRCYLCPICKQAMVVHYTNYGFSSPTLLNEWNNVTVSPIQQNGSAAVGYYGSFMSLA